MKKYPKELNPFNGSQTELFAFLFGSLSGAYNMLAQYEREEEEREKNRLEQVFMEDKPAKESKKK